MMGAELLKYSEAIATLTAVVVAIGVALYQIARQNALKRRELTISVLSYSYLDDVLQRAAIRINEIVASKKKSNDLSKEDRDDLLIMLNYYSFVSGAALDRWLDVGVIKAQKGAAMIRAFDLLYPWVEQQRTALGEPLFLRRLERFVSTVLKPHQRQRLKLYKVQSMLSGKK